MTDPTITPGPGDPATPAEPVAATDPREVTGVQLTLDPNTVRLDAAGRVTLADAKVLSAILTRNRLPEALGNLASDSNAIGCGGNGYQCSCGKIPAVTDSIIDQ